MKQLWILLFVFFANWAQGAEPQEPFLRDLPPGVYLTKSTTAAGNTTAAIGKKLGGEIERLTNSNLRVYGRPIQVNVITAANGKSSDTIYSAFLKIKSEKFCRRDGLTVIEFTGQGIDEALVKVTSYALGFLDKPDSINYRLKTQFAPVSSLDYMACNTMFNLLASFDSSGGSTGLAEIEELHGKFNFGNQLILRSPLLACGGTKYGFEPSPVSNSKKGPAVSYSFGQLPVNSLSKKSSSISSS